MKSFISASGFRSILGISFLMGTSFLAIDVNAAGTAVAAKPTDSAATPYRLAILDLVDLNDNQIRTEPSEWLRRSIASSTRFTVLPRDTMVKRLAEFGVNASLPCNNAQCSFDVGNYLQADFILYGTYSPLTNADAITLKMVYVAKAQIAWTWVGEIQYSGGIGGDKTQAWERQFTTLTRLLQGVTLILEKPKVHKSLAVVDLSDQSYLSKVFSERILTRINSFPQYELLSPSEVAELFTALEINKYSIVPSVENMIGLGQKLGVASLIYSRVYRDGKNYLCRIAMYDVEGKGAILDFPPRPTVDFTKLLEYERDFFEALAAKDKKHNNAPLQAAKPEKSHKTLWISLGLLGVGGGLGWVWVDNLKKEGGPNATPNFPDPRDPPFGSEDF